MTDGKKPGKATRTLILGFLAASLAAPAASNPDCSQITYNGSGTETEPYEVASLDHLQCIEDGSSAIYSITENINASETSDWTEGFSPLQSFEGSLEGNNKSVTNLYLAPESYSGLFSRLNQDGAVRNLSLIDVTVGNGGWYTGAVAGVNNGKISNVYTSGSISGEGSVGGIAGGNNGSIERSYSEAAVSGESYVGGLVGENFRSGKLLLSYSEGEVDADNTAGGLVGYSKGSVESVYSVATVEAGSWNYSGSFIGLNSGSISAGYWLEDGNPKSYWYKTPTDNYGDINGSALDEQLMQSDACGMTGFNFSKNWDTVQGDFPRLQDSGLENESRNCEEFTDSKDEGSSPGYPGLAILLIGIAVLGYLQYRILLYVDEKVF